MLAFAHLWLVLVSSMIAVVIGLSGFNTACVLQSALLVALLAIISDMLFERWPRALDVNYGR